MQNDMVNCGNPYEEGDAVLDASTIASYKPITGELRRYLHDVNENLDEEWLFVNIRWDRVNELCDAIDAVHAQLESDYKTERETNECLRKKLANVREQLTNVQKALEDRNKGVLKQRWQKKCDALNGEIESLKKEVLSLKGQLTAAKDEDQGHAYAPESHYMLLPKDVDGVPIHIFDLMETSCGVETVEGVLGDRFLVLRNGVWITLEAVNFRHAKPDSWERIIGDAIREGIERGTTDWHDRTSITENDALVARCKALAGDEA